MADDIQRILCGSCSVPIEGPDDAESDSLFACPKCGRSDSHENVLIEVKAFITEVAQRSLQESMKKAAQGSKMLQFKGEPIPKRTYRFVTDHKL